MNNLIEAVEAAMDRRPDIFAPRRMPIAGPGTAADGRDADLASGVAGDPKPPAPAPAAAALTDA